MTERRRTGSFRTIWDTGTAAATVIAVLAGSALSRSVAAGSGVGSVAAGSVVAGGESAYALELSLGLILGALLLVRRRWPVAVLALSAGTVVAYRTADLTAVGWLWPALAAYAGAVLAQRLGWAIGIAVGEAAFAASWESTRPGADQPGALARIGFETLLVAVVIATAYAYRNWRRWQDELALRLRAVAEEQEAEAGRRRAEERLRIARELHDLVAHTLAVVGVHLNVATDALDTAPAQTRDALLLAKQVRARAMTDLRSLITVLRDGDPDATEPTASGQPAIGPPALGQPVTGPPVLGPPVLARPMVEQPAVDLSGLADLVALVAATGLRVNLDVTGELADVPAPLALSVYRIVQEALTNVVRHSGATVAEVTIRRAVNEIALSIADNGRGSGPTPVAGHGINGMAERAVALGGTLSYESRPNGGFAIVASLPLEPLEQSEPLAPPEPSEQSEQSEPLASSDSSRPLAPSRPFLSYGARG